MTLRIQSQCGFTLLELLIVLALLALFMSIGFPLLDRSLARARFKSGVIELQTVLLHTRLQAMKSGNAHIFRFLPGTACYEVLPLDVFRERKIRHASSTGLGGTLAPVPGPITDLTTFGPNGPGTLSDPEGDSMLDQTYIKETSGEVMFRSGIVVESPNLKPQGHSAFVDGEIEIDTGSRMIGSLTDIPGEGVKTPKWSEPILFYPNGRTSQAVLELEFAGKYPLYAEMVLRGLTGTARIDAISSYPPDSSRFSFSDTVSQ